jgi:hypothetical protein
MAIYEIEQYEIHAYTYHVEAPNKAHAIEKLFRGDCEPQEGIPQYIGPSEDLGLPVSESFAEKLEQLGIQVEDGSYLPSIRSIRKIKT